MTPLYNDIIGKLPWELFEITFGFLHICDVVRCRQLSRAFCTFIDNSATFQYRIELLLSGMEDSGVSNLSVHEKRRLLSQYTLARDTLQPDLLVDQHMNILNEERFWDVSNGIGFQFMDAPIIEFTQCPSPMRGIPRRSWELTIPSPHICSVDPSQDLLLAVYLDGNRFFIRPLSLSTGEQHPCSTSAQIFIPSMRFDNIYEVCFELALADNKFTIFACDLDDDDGKPMISIGDWKSGQIYRHIREKGIESFSLLDKDHLLLASICESKQAAKLSVIDINTLARFEFLFPKFTWELGPFDISISSGPEVPSPSLSQSGVLPFQIATEDRLIVVELRDGNDTMSSFVVPTWALQKEVTRLKNENNNRRRRTRCVSWDKWGISCTALLHNHLFYTPSFFSYGTRYITIEDEVAVIYDFNRFAVRRAKLSDARQNGQESEINGVDNLSSSPLFADDVKTSILWRRLVTMLSLKGYDGIGIDNDWITLSSPDGPNFRVISF